VAQRARNSASKTPAPRVRTFGTAAVSARQAVARFWSRESLLRLALSFILSVALWLYITAKQDPGRAQDFPQPLSIETQNLGTGLAVTTNVTSVHVQYRSDAPGAIVTSVNFHPIVNLSGMQAGPHTVPVHVIPDPGLHVVQVTPSRILATVDRIESRVVGVTPTILTTAPSGYTVGTIRLNPGAIHVQGPHTIVSEINGASIEIDLSGVTATLDNSYKPVLRDSQGAPLTGSSRIQIDPPQIQVHVPVAALSSLKTLPVLVPFAGKVKAGYRVVSVAANPGEIIAKGSPSTLTKVSGASTGPIHLAGRKSTFTTHVRLGLGRGLSSNTQSVAVTIGIQLIKTP
jgi:YbbR domain-containing protein